MRGTGNLDMAKEQDSGTALISTSPISTHSSNSHSLYMQSFLTSLRQVPSVPGRTPQLPPELPTRST